jgi:hypothetical protein
VVSELQRGLLVQERRFVVAYEIGLSSHYICSLVVESGCHRLVLVAVSALNNIGAAIPLVVSSCMIRSVRTVIRLIKLISQYFKDHLLLINFIVLYTSEIIHSWRLLVKK